MNDVPDMKGWKQIHGKPLTWRSPCGKKRAILQREWTGDGFLKDTVAFEELLPFERKNERGAVFCRGTHWQTIVKYWGYIDVKFVGQEYDEEPVKTITIERVTL